MSSFTPPPPNFGATSSLAMLFGSKKYVHLSFTYPTDFSALAASHFIQPIINTADDWLKYADNCWIIWSYKSPKDWYDKLAEIQELKNCSMLAVNVDLSPGNRAGQFPKWVWDWLDKPRY
jgi:hypothetical protein